MGARDRESCECEFPVSVSFGAVFRSSGRRSESPEEEREGARDTGVCECVC